MRRDVQEIFRSTPHEKQVMMFSATLSKDIRPVCKKFMQDVRKAHFYQNQSQKLRENASHPTSPATTALPTEHKSPRQASRSTATAAGASGGWRLFNFRAKFDLERRFHIFGPFSCATHSRHSTHKEQMRFVLSLVLMSTRAIESPFNGRQILLHLNEPSSRFFSI